MLANCIEIATALTNFEPHILALHPAQLRQRLQEHCDPCLRVRTTSACKHPNTAHDGAPLSRRDNRPRCSRAAEQRDEVTPSDVRHSASFQTRFACRGTINKR